VFSETYVYVTCRKPEQSVVKFEIDKSQPQWKQWKLKYDHRIANESAFVR